MSTLLNAALRFGYEKFYALAPLDALLSNGVNLNFSTKPLRY
jgi:hypothetical protein